MAEHRVDLRRIPREYRDLCKQLQDEGFGLLHGARHMYVLSPEGHKVGTIPRHPGSKMTPDALLRKIRRRVEQ